MVVEITVGRHTAEDGAHVHPLVAAALEERHGAGTGTHRTAAAEAGPEGEGGLGWPGPPGDGTGLGWPADTDKRATPVAAPVGRRSVWRRLFSGPARAAQDAGAA